MIIGPGSSVCFDWALGLRLSRIQQHAGRDALGALLFDSGQSVDHPISPIEMLNDKADKENVNTIKLTFILLLSPPKTHCRKHGSIGA